MNLSKSDAWHTLYATLVQPAVGKSSIQLAAILADILVAATPKI